MSSISNTFIITSVVDGTTLHGSLLSDKTLVQAYNGISATPDWTQSSEQPTIYLSLLDGATQVQPDLTTISWTYNGQTIVFNENSDISISPASAAGLFQILTYRVDGLDMPALKIIGNLANAGNKDLDLVGISGKVEINGANIDFGAETQIRISEISPNGYLGVLEFPNGKTIDTPNTTIRINAKLYGGDTSGLVSTYYVKWLVNGDVVSSGVVDDNTNHLHYITLNETTVVDYAVVQAEFYLDSAKTDLKATQIDGVDDTQDPEYLYIQTSGSKALRKNENVQVDAWVGKSDDPTVKQEWNVFELKILKSDGTVDLTSYTSYAGANIPDVDSDGWRPLSVDQQTTHKASVTITYGVVTSLGRNMTGLIRATKSQS